MEIKWDEAPVGYPLWIEFVEGNILPGWYRDDGDGRYVSPWGGWINTSAASAGRCIVHRRPEPEPEPVAWDGDGGEMPPVGTLVMFHNPSPPKEPGDCNFEDDSIPDLWRDGDTLEVLAYSKPHHVCPVVVNLRDKRVSTVDMRWIRPIPTPEQKAAQERERAVKQLCLDIPNLSVRLATEIYDAGYRKAEES